MVRPGFPDPLGVGLFDLGERVSRRQERGLLLPDLLLDLAIIDQRDELARLDPVAHLDLHFLDPARRLGADLDDGPHLGLDDPGLHQNPADAAFFDGSGVQNLGGRLDKEYPPDHNGRQQKRDGDTGKEDDFFLRWERFDRCEIHG